MDKSEKIIYDMLFFDGKMIYKTKHFCEAVGLEKSYLAGILMPGDCDGKEGTLEITQSVNKQSGELESRVKDYVKKEEEFFNDPIGF